MLSTIVARVLPDPSSSRAIGELVSQQTSAYNEAVTRLNRGISIPKRSSKKDSRGFNQLLTKWRHEEPYRRHIPYSIHQTGWEQGWEANEKMRDDATRRINRIARCHAEGKPVKKRDAKQHRRTLALRDRKSNPALITTEGRMFRAKGHTITLVHLHHGFTIKTTAQRLDLLAIAAGTGDVLMARLREGRANTARGAAHFLRETVSRVRYGGARGQLTVRAGSGFGPMPCWPTTSGMSWDFPGRGRG